MNPSLLLLRPGSADWPLVSSPEMATGSMEAALIGDPTAKLPDDLLVEVISRVPYKSTCCCKCVSTRWRDLISHPDHRKIFPRSTLAGFFYTTLATDDHPHLSHGYRSVSGNWCPHDASLSFLSEYESLQILDCCNGLLLCRARKSTDPETLDDPKTLDYVVCNPATEKWVTVPATKWSWLVDSACLGFDPAVSAHFYVFELVPDIAWDPSKRDHYSIKAVGIYSSESGVWTHPIEILCLSGCAFLSRVLYLCPDNNSVAAVDVEGNCRIIPIPTSHDAPDCPNVYASQGQLYLTIQGASELSIWVLEDSSSENCWTLKLNVSHLRLFGIEYSSSEQYYGVISAHPEHDVIFIIKGFRLWYRPEKKLFSYDMDSGELCFICDLPWNSTCPYLSYVPLFSESLADGH
ncbi:unnamed protein product [Triticum turgidum subsp. durum]|uniref:F-box domain-containing protein n=1 Tax=Triticum turgidum subsp. durum TaxID=4567 RepID=A0A9R1QXF5_TRITD|nr:unnamed protein product [Triticum turgidum subsp. durum]